MKAVCWQSKGQVHVDKAPDPRILNPHDGILRITLTALCGSDLHLYGGYIPALERGDILGHEFMGEVVEVGSDVRNVKKSDRVVIPFCIWGCSPSRARSCSALGASSPSTASPTGWRRPDSCIDAVGMEAHGTGISAASTTG
jgi:threonine dehydrogenase-like Zn-dependent dehydrogenase